MKLQKIRLFWTKFSYCIFVQRSSTGLYGVPMAIILQPISIRKCNINTLTTTFLRFRVSLYIENFSSDFAGWKENSACRLERKPRYQTRKKVLYIAIHFDCLNKWKWTQRYKPISLTRGYLNVTLTSYRFGVSSMMSYLCLLR